MTAATAQAPDAAGVVELPDPDRVAGTGWRVAAVRRRAGNWPAPDGSFPTILTVEVEVTVGRDEVARLDERQEAAVKAAAAAVAAAERAAGSDPRVADAAGRCERLAGQLAEARDAHAAA